MDNGGLNFNITPKGAAEALVGASLVLVLRATVVGVGADAGGAVADPHRALGLVAVLPTRPAGPVAIDVALPHQLVVTRQDRRVP